jgi:excisionase family DNA binding protein
MSEELLSTREVARRLGVTRRQVQRLAKSGRLPNAFKVGKTWVVPQRDVVKLQKARAPDQRRSE